MKAAGNRPDSAPRKRMALIHVEAFGWTWGVMFWRRPAEQETEHDGERSDDRERGAR